MEKKIIGKKIGMTQIFVENGEMLPVTVIEAGPCAVMQIKTADKEGYNAVQLGFGSTKEKNVCETITCGNLFVSFTLSTNTLILLPGL